MAHIPDKRFFRPDEVAEILSVSKRTILRLMDEDKLTWVWVRSHKRISNHEVERYVRENTNHVAAN